MEMRNKNRKYDGVKIYNNLRYFLDAKELSFIIHLKKLSELRAYGCRTAYSREFNFKSFQLSRNVFYRCAKRLEKLGLLIRVQVGVFVDYHLDHRNYKKLSKIANSTNDIYILSEFNDREFILNKRSIDDISETEILELKSKKKEHSIRV